MSILEFSNPIQSHIVAERMAMLMCACFIYAYDTMNGGGTRIKKWSTMADVLFSDTYFLNIIIIDSTLNESIMKSARRTTTLAPATVHKTLMKCDFSALPLPLRNRVLLTLLYLHPISVDILIIFCSVITINMHSRQINYEHNTYRSTNIWLVFPSFIHTSLYSLFIYVNTYLRKN